MMHIAIFSAAFSSCAGRTYYCLEKLYVIRLFLFLLWPGLFSGDPLRYILGLSCYARIWTVRTTSRFGRLQLKKFLQGSDSLMRKRNIRIRSIGRNCVRLDSRTRGKCLFEG